MLDLTPELITPPDWQQKAKEDAAGITENFYAFVEGRVRGFMPVHFMYTNPAHMHTLENVLGEFDMDVHVPADEAPLVVTANGGYRLIRHPQLSEDGSFFGESLTVQAIGQEIGEPLGQIAVNKALLLG